MMDWFIGGFVILGAFFTLIAGIGVVRFPDIYTRMHAVSKSMTLGLGSILIATMLRFDSISANIKSFLIILFLFLTIPVATQILSLVAYRRGSPLWEKTKLNEFDDTSL